MGTALRPDQRTPPVIPEKRSIWTRWWMIVLYFAVGVAALAALLTVLVGSPGEEAGPSASTVSQATVESATPGVPEGYELFDGSEHGFTIAHPSRWVSIGFTMTPEEIVEGGEEMGADPDAIGSFQEMVREGEGPDLYAQDGLSGDNMSIFSLPLGPTDTLDNFEAMQPALVDRLGATLLSLDRVEVAGFESLRVVYEWRTPQAVMEGHNYLVFAPDDTLYEITVTFGDPDESDRQTAMTIIDTFRVVAGN